MRAQKYEHPKVEVLCTKCNKSKTIVNKYDLVKGKTKMCKMCSGKSRGTSKYNFYIGYRKGDWQVVKIDTKKSIVICLCTKCNKTIKQFSYSYFFKTKSQRCAKCGRTKGAETATLTSEQYKRRLQKINSTIKLKDGEKYIKYDTKIKHICPICKQEWLVTPHNILKGVNMCDKCSNYAIESKMISVLKQVFMHERPNTTKWEYDVGFKGKNHGKSKYDIYDGFTNTLIEGQSQYHDIKKEYDEKKKKYAITNGYNFIAIDCRNYSPLKAVQLFFPEIKEIPDYVDLSGKNTRRNWDINTAQALLNKHHAYKEIAKIVNCTYNDITTSIMKGDLIKPIGYKTKKDINWDLGLAQKLLNDGKTCIEVAKQININPKTLYWSIKKGNPVKPSDYKIVKSNKNKMKKILQYDLNNNLVGNYLGCKNVKSFKYDSIARACRGKYYGSHKYKEYLWYYDA